MSTGLQETDCASRLERARTRLAEVEARIDDHGEETITETAEAYRNAADLLERYVDRATGTGRENFKAYVELEGKFASLVEGLPDDLAHRGSFEAALEAIDKRRLSESDFERAEAALEPAAAFSELLEEREDAREALEEARKAANRRIREIDAEIEERERLRELGAADLEAPVERLHEPIEAYNAAVREAFEAYRHDVSAREVFALCVRSRLYPFVSFKRPPEDLERYVTENPAGEYAIPQLLEYAGYSRSKLDHYVEDADELKRQVATQQTYLEGIDAGALTIAWPPDPAGVLRRRTRELQPFVDRVADESVGSLLREVRGLTRSEEYDRLRTAAVALERLTDDQRRRLAAGAVDDELAALRDERERLREALAADEPA